MDSHAAHNSPELIACQTGLRCIVEGVGKDQLLIRFSHIDPSDSRREASFVLDVSARSYKGVYLTAAICHSPMLRFLVLTSTPPLPTLPIMLDKLNESRDVFAFIRSVRQGYQEMYK